MPDLARDDLFDAFRRRRHYVTTGARIFLDVSATSVDGSNEDRVLMGDIVETDSTGVDLHFEVERTAPIERVDVFDGTHIIRTTRPWTLDDAQSRLRITCAGQNDRGRGRLVRWKGSARISQGSIGRISAANFWNLQKRPELTAPDSVAWEVATTGGASAVDLFVDEDAWEGEIAIDTSDSHFSVRAADIGIDDLRFDCGGMDKRLILSRLPALMECSSLRDSIFVPLQSEMEARLYLRVTQEDGHQAWSSLIYTSRR